MLHLIASDDQRADQALLESLRDGSVTSGSLERQLIRGDGGKVWSQLTLSLVRASAGLPNALMVVVEDISERKRATTAIETVLRGGASQIGPKFFSSMIEQVARALDADLAFIAERIGEEGERMRILAIYTDGSLAENLEYQLIGTPCEMVLKEGVCSYCEEVVRQFPEARLLSDNGVQGYVGVPLHDARGEAIGIMVVLFRRELADSGFVESILRILAARTAAEIERMRTQAELERVGMALEQATEMIFITDLSGAITYVNPAFEKVTSYRREDVLGMHPEMIRFSGDGGVPPADGEVWSGRSSVHRDDGSTVTVEASVSPVRSGEGDIVSYVCVARDITDRLDLESQLQHAQRMEAVGRLAGGVAHDFNNMLTVIAGYSDLITDSLDPNDPLYECAEEITKAAARASGVTKQLLAFSRKSVLKPIVFNLNDLISELEKMLGRLIEEDVTIDLVLAPELGQVRADRAQISQVLMNLVVNARDAIAGTGMITIETANLSGDEAHRLCSDLLVDKEYVELRVTDTGSGMSSAVASRVFEPFFSTKGEGKGTGLGLSMVYGIVVQSGGHIVVSSEPGKGSQFRLLFPVVSERPDTKPPSGLKPSARRGCETVLLVEDERMVRRLALRFLRHHGYTVLEAANPGEALLICERTAEPIHLMITDVVMPQMSGPELAERLKALAPDMAVLYMSGHMDEAIARYRERDHQLPLVEKPFTEEALVSRVRDILDCRRS